MEQHEDPLGKHDGWTTKPVLTRFSDFGENGSLHETRSFAFFEQARLEIAEESGFVQSLPEDDDWFFPVIDIQYHMKSSVSLGDVLFTQTRLHLPSIARLDFEHRLLAGNTVCIEATIKVAVVSRMHGLLFSFDESIKSRVKEFLNRSS